MNGRNGLKKGAGRDAGGFVALPWAVLDSPAYAALSHPARSLLMEFARQFVRDNNGRLLASSAYLKKRGWNSADVITRAKRELERAGFIFETVTGRRPNRASWYAVTWLSLDRLHGYDEGTLQAFVRSAYKNAGPEPSHGAKARPNAPLQGAAKASSAPSRGAIRASFEHLSTPSHGNHLEMPSTASIL